ncbi:MAG TPA: hypothetical protein VK249_32335 [Anaerolineales bacterium]|nr:hypothetical protein [Anaerolineales bacterium]
MTYQAGQILNLFLYSLPFWIPAAVGLYLVVKRPSDLSLMAGLLTLKPIVTTPIWFAIISPLSGSNKLEPAHFWSILPGISLTVIIVLAFRRLFFVPGAGKAKTLLVLDCARWLNSFLLSLPLVGGMGGGSLACIFSLIGLVLPTVFAVVALMLSLTRVEESFRSNTQNAP